MRLPCRRRRAGSPARAADAPGLLGALDRYWFAPAPAERLALLRILVGGYTLWYLRKRVRMFDQIARTDPAVFQPVGVARLLNKPLPPQLAKVLTAATVGSTAAFTLGLGHRVVGPLHATLLLWTLSYRNSWSMIFHNDNTLVLHSLVLGASASADALSLDAARRGPSPDLGRPSWRYGWPINLLNAVTAVAYLLAGVAKVKGPLGLGWATGEALRSQVAIDGLRKELLGKQAAPLGVKLYGYTGLYRLLAVGSLAAELLAPLVLASSRLSRLWALNAFLMHWGIDAVMGIKFRYHQSGVIYAPFFPVERLLPAARR